MKKRGISLIVLIVTIIVIIILAAVVILTLSKNNPINSAKEATFKEDIYNYKTELEVYKANISKNGEDVTRLYASKDSDPSIKDVITSITRKYIDRLEVREGKLVYVGKDKIEYILAKDMGLLPEDELLDDDILTELKPFIIEWTVEAGDSIKLPIGGTCNFTVDYGDNSGEYKVTSSSDEDRIHTYENAGTYTIKITGKCERINFDNTPNDNTNKKISKLIQWGSLGLVELKFSECENLKGPIPIPSKNSLTNLNSLYRFFNGCKKLDGEIPEELFYGCNKVTSARSSFYGCENITGSIPQNLFRDCININSFIYTFRFCKQITGNIPEKLFEKNTNVTTFESVFEGCENISGNIPAKLFEKNINVISFKYTFSKCKNLTGNIPEILFDNCRSVTSFYGTFGDCIKLSGNIPNNLFKNCPEVENFRSTFNGCKSLTESIPQTLFNNNQKAKNFTYTFKNCSSLTGSAPALWERTNVTDNLECFSKCTNLSNYNDIPTGWK